MWIKFVTSKKWTHYMDETCSSFV